MDGAIVITGGKPVVSDIKTDPINFSPHSSPHDSIPNSTTISYALSKDANITIRIFDSNNTLVRTLDEGLKPSGANTAVWDGKNDYAELVMDDRYRIEIQADIDGNYSDTRRAHTEVYY